MIVNPKEEKNRNGSSAQSTKPEDEDTMEKLVEEMAEFICEKLCRFPLEIDDQDDLEYHCTGCEMSDFICSIQNEYNSVNNFVESQLGITMEKYKDIVLCKECIHRAKEEDCQGGEYYWCRNDDGLDGYLKENSGCSRGKRI